MEGKKLNIDNTLDFYYSVLHVFKWHFKLLFLKCWYFKNLVPSPHTQVYSNRMHINWKKGGKNDYKRIRNKASRSKVVFVKVYKLIVKNK